MKKFTKFLALLSVAGFAFTSCDKLTDEIAYPSFEKITLEERTDGTFFGRFDVTCDQTVSLKEVTATYTYGSTTLSIPDKDLDITKGKNYRQTDRSDRSRGYPRKQNHPFGYCKGCQRR